MSLFYLNNRNNIVQIDNDLEGSYYNPRDFNDITKFVTWERDFYSPDTNPFDTWQNMMEYFGAIFTGNLYQDVEALVRSANHKGYILSPVYKYKHNVIYYEPSLHNPFPDKVWDSSICGVIYANKNDVRNFYNVKKISTKIKEEVYNLFASQLKDYTNYINGWAIRYKEFDLSLGHEIDSCGGFLGSTIKDSDIEEYAGACVKELGYYDSLEECLKSLSISFENIESHLKEDVERFLEQNQSIEEKIQQWQQTSEERNKSKDLAYHNKDEKEK